MVRQTVEYRSALLPGDTAHVELLVRETVWHSAGLGGRVTFEDVIRKHDDSVVLNGEWEMVVRVRGVGTRGRPITPDTRHGSPFPTFGVNR